MADMRTVHLCLVGRFLKFLPGEKSPYQRLLLETRSSEGRFDPESDGPVEHQIVLGKNLRRMMYRYLDPQDWVRVVGTQSLNRRSGLMEWKATEISKLSAEQVDQLQRETILPKVSDQPKPIRVLICQQSDCRQRGSSAVSQAMKETIDADCLDISIQATGCMKRCKIGPNVVMVPGRAHSQVTPGEGRSLIQSIRSSDS